MRSYKTFINVSNDECGNKRFSLRTRLTPIVAFFILQQYVAKTIAFHLKKSEVFWNRILLYSHIVNI